MRREYDNAISESRRATEIDPKYTYALFDLCLAYYWKAVVSQLVAVRAEALQGDAAQFFQNFFAQHVAVHAEALQGFVETYHKICEIEIEEDSSVQNLPPAALQNLHEMLQWVLQQITVVGGLASLLQSGDASH
jgi:hypothetical protein